MMKKFSLLFAFAVTLSVNAQLRDPLNRQGQQILTFKDGKSSTAGTKYFNEQFSNATITDVPGTTPLRYDAFSDTFEVEKYDDNGQIGMLPKTKNVIITFLKTRESYCYIDYINKKKENNSGYLKIVSNNSNFKIYKKESIILLPEVIPSNSYQTAKPPTYKKAENEFYIELNPGSVVQFDGKKELANMIPGKKKEILDYIKKNDIDVENEMHLKNLGNYINSLL